MNKIKFENTIELNKEKSLKKMELIVKNYIDDNYNNLLLNEKILLKFDNILFTIEKVNNNRDINIVRGKLKNNLIYIEKIFFYNKNLKIN